MSRFFCTFTRPLAHLKYVSCSSISKYEEKAFILNSFSIISPWALFYQKLYSSTELNFQKLSDKQCHTTICPLSTRYHWSFYFEMYITSVKDVILFKYGLCFVYSAWNLWRLPHVGWRKDYLQMSLYLIINPVVSLKICLSRLVLIFF